MEEKLINHIVELINKSSNIVVLTGAGVSVPSGVPDFRSPNGLYTKYGQDIFDIDEFNRNPDRFYAFAREGLLSMLEVKPNLMHLLLAELEKLGKLKGVITQNIDGLHTKAGNRNVAEIHGSVRIWNCLRCSRRYEILDFAQREFLLSNNFRCSCGGLTKPDIVFFGEMLPLNEFTKAQNWAIKSDVFLAIGTSLVVYPAAQLPLYALRNGAKLVIITKGDTPLDRYAYLKFDVDLIEFAENLSQKLNLYLS
ncbi:NAD-dependent deacylase [Fervidobacterium riparium]|uniref:protein acetyllysine N-acetyltransferase n=3 Tax=Fervidobacterium gondwanense TaxID=44754 RepID=A0A1M7TBV5_FERGO|nr:NAD-dependent deacylase [Fervidobacterium gondwanense]UXF01775.1 NAD-dependent deacetylase [Fervidobacterium riparium]SHN68166.1 NAD-dependent deacetylase [Fervidobacterium gondwanense DSM 13020]